MPGLISWPEDPAKPCKVVDLSAFDTSQEVLDSLQSAEDHRQYLLWQSGRNVSNAHFVQQCGASLQIVQDKRQPLKNKVGEEDVVEPPRLEIDHDELVVQAEDVQGRDDAIALIRDDEDLLVQIFQNLEDAGSVHLISSDTMATMWADVMQMHLQLHWRRFRVQWKEAGVTEGHFLKVTLEQPQPVELTHQGIVMVVALQHVFAGAPTPPDGSILCLAGIQLVYAGAHHPEIHRAMVIEETFDPADLRIRLQLNDLCQPHGRRECEYQLEHQTLAEGREVRGRMGSYIVAKIGEEKQIFGIRNSCREVDSILQDLRAATQDARLRQIRLIQYGYRFRPIGRVSSVWRQNGMIDKVSLAQCFAEGWQRQPIDTTRFWES